MGCFGAGTACFRAAQALVWGLFGLLFDALRTKVCSFPMRYVFPSVALSGAAFAGVPFSVLKKSAFGGNECRGSGTLREVGPPWGPAGVAGPVRRFAALTRGYQRFAPFGDAGLAAFVRGVRLRGLDSLGGTSFRA